MNTLLRRLFFYRPKKSQRTIPRLNLYLDHFNGRQVIRPHQIATGL